MRYLIIGLLCAFSFSAFAQEQEPEVYNSSGKTQAQLKREAARKKAAQRGKFDASRLVFGGGFGGGISDNATSIGVSPIVGYRFTDHFTAGISLGYQYIRIKDRWVLADPYDPSKLIAKPLIAHIYSPGVWARHTIWNNIFAHVEYQQNLVSLNRFKNDYTKAIPEIVEEKLKFSQPALWAGAGVRQPLGERVSFVFIALYNVLPDTYGLYGSRIDFRFGINAGF